MRKGAVAAAAGALVAVVLGFTLLARPDRTEGRATLRVVRAFPLTIRGQHFRARERVRLTTGAVTIQTKASPDGFFVVTIRGTDRCNSSRVLARGSAGSYAVVKNLPPPACAPARSS